MAKATSQFVCQNCSSTFSRWSGKCMQCGAWDSLVEEVRAVAVGGSKAKVQPLQTTKLSAVNGSKQTRISTNISEVDTVLGGGIVPGSLILLAGDPGIGKSTLVLQVAAHIAQGKSVLYVSGEESAAQIKLRADRIKGVKADFDFAGNTDLDAVLGNVQASNYDLVILDSIQTMSTAMVSSAAGTISQITNATSAIMQVGKSTNTSFIIIGHVTKEGNLAGPRMLEHLVDTVLYLEGEKYGAFKILKSVKNRFGSTNEVGILEMTDAGLHAVKNPSEHLLQERSSAPGSAILATMEGSRPLLVEVQALVSPSVFGYPKRSAVGIDLNRLSLLAAVITKRGGVNLSQSDIYVNIVGGLRITEPAIDLAIILSIASASKNVIIPPDTVVFGEVGLSGEVRSVHMSERRLAEARKLGFTKAIVPPSVSGSGVIKARTIADAIKALK